MGTVYNEKSTSKIAEEFSWLQDECYLDYAGAGLYSSKQLKNSKEDLCSNLYGNPHSLNSASRLTNDLIDQIRFKILDLFHTNSEQYTVVFTSNATQAIKIVLECFKWNSNDDKEKNATVGTFAYTAVNHTSVIGGRVLASLKNANILCLSEGDAENIFQRQKVVEEPRSTESNSLFAFPAQCNFSGKKYPLDWIKKVHDGFLEDTSKHPSSWFCLLDAATYCSTNDLNLSVFFPDFVCLSFYKIFGYPTGVGALLIRNSSAHCLQKNYFGGGTIEISIPGGSFHRMRNDISQRFEDGTVPFLSIISLAHAFDTLQRIGISMKQISLHTFLLAKQLVSGLNQLHHWNNNPLAVIYSDSFFDDITKQGGIVAFNLKRADGSVIGFMEVLQIANLYKINFRTGCFCNVGACQKYLNLNDSDLLLQFEAGHICGDERDLISGRPTGAIRVSFGYPSTQKDVNKLLTVLSESFLENTAPEDVLHGQTEIQNPVLKSIRLYPIKSCGAMEVSTWTITRRGLDFDRQWMVVSSSGVCLTQKQEPMLCKILPYVDPVSSTLVLTYSGEDPIIVINQSKSGEVFEMCTNKVCGDRVQGNDCGDSVSKWLCKHLGKDGLRLVKQCTNDTRKSKIQEYRGRPEELKNPLSLANQAQYLLVNEESVNWLGRRIADEPDFDCDTLVDRFRANFIISGVKEFEELDWKEINVGSLSFKVEGACTRCQMICIDQKTGAKNRKPLVELSRAFNGKMRFGIYCSHIDVEEEARISVDDIVSIKT